MPIKYAEFTSMEKEGGENVFQKLIPRCCCIFDEPHLLLLTHKVETQGGAVGDNKCDRVEKG